MDEIEITKDLIRTLALYGIVKGWDTDTLMEEYEQLEIPIDLVHETLSEGIE